MTTFKPIRLREYIVEITDRRTGEKLTDTVVFERDPSNDLELYGMDIKHAINCYYSKRGYEVGGISKGKARRAYVELSALFAASDPEGLPVPKVAVIPNADHMEG